MTSHKKLARAFPRSLHVVLRLEGDGREQDEGQRIPVRGRRLEPGGWSVGWRGGGGGRGI